MSTTSTSQDGSSNQALEAEGQLAAEAAEVTYDGVDFSTVEITEYHGMSMPHSLLEPAELHVPRVKNLKLRDSDIFLLTYPKSGTHWLWRVLDMLASGSAAYGDRTFLQFFLDLKPAHLFDNMGAGCRRIFNLHYPFHLLPSQVKDGRVKVVHLYRHPKAVLVSLLCHLQSSGLAPDITLDKLEAAVHSGKALYHSQFYYFDKVKEYERDNPNVDIFHLAYEDMKQDTVGCIKKLAAYLNVEASDELCASIVEAVSFKKQKEQEGILDTKPPKVTIFRKGEVDDWKNHLTVAQSERIDKVLADRAVSCQFSRRYCPTITTDQETETMQPTRQLRKN